MTRHIQRPGEVRTLCKNYVRIFRDIQRYSCIFIYTSKRATRGRGGRPPLPYFKNQKKCSDFGRKGPDCVYLCFIQNVVVKLSTFLFCRNVFRSALVPRNLPCPEHFGCGHALRHYPYLKCLIKFWIRLFLDNCSVICTVMFLVDTGHKLNVHTMFRRRSGRLLNVLCTFNSRLVSTELCYVLCRHIQNSAMFRTLFTKVYSGIFKDIRNH